MASDDGRNGVEKAYKARKEELEEAAQADQEEADEPELVAVAKSDVEVLAAKVAERVNEDAQLRPQGATPDHVDKALAGAHEELQQLAKADGKEVEVPLTELQEIVNAIAQKANRDQRQRGMMQPSPAQRALMDAKAKANELEI